MHSYRGHLDDKYETSYWAIFSVDTQAINTIISWWKYGLPNIGRFHHRGDALLLQ